MLSLKQIVKSITIQLNTKFPNINVTSRDIKEGFQRPSFFIEIDSNSSNSGMYTTQRNLTVRVYYFPSDMYENELELLQMQDDLAQLFSFTIKIEGRVITLADTAANVVDGVLQYEFDLNYLDSSDNSNDENNELMQELAFKVRKEDE